MKKMLLGALGAACLALALQTAALAQEVTSKTLVDRLQVQDLITRYYNNFGRENAESFSDFYAEDAELILGAKSYKGKNGILEAYGRAPGQAPKVITQGKEYSTFVKNKGQWRYRTRQIKAGTELPYGWKE